MSPVLIIFAVVIISTILFFIVLFLTAPFVEGEKSKPKLDDSNLLKVPNLKTMKDVLKHHLTEAPTGCMWQVEKGTTNYRKLSTGKMVFDGAHEGSTAKVTLITSKGPFKSFTIVIGDEGNWLREFSASLGQNKVKVLNAYARSIDDWDGIYMKDVL